MEELQIPLNDKVVERMFEECLKERKLVLNEEIYESTLERFTLQIMKWNKEDKGLPAEKRKPIIIYINSLGGSVVNGLSMIDVIKLSKTPVIGVVLGYACSMGGIILTACHKRYSLKNSTVLIHDGSGGAYGSTNKVKDQMRYLEKQDEVVKGIIIENTLISKEKYEDMEDREWYILGNEMKELGIIDGFVGDDIDIDEIL